VRNPGFCGDGRDNVAGFIKGINNRVDAVYVDEFSGPRRYTRVFAKRVLKNQLDFVGG
jgi:hypothetical protein